ncbi:MAG: UvrD-helicase domain-containing protein, partial [Chloroflexi bacterium]|nr:UvrD-helicase domain-containing protein [Chloroflexota bacterium]
CGVSPRRIMADTFTNKAAREMQERLARLLGSVQKDLTVGTFHAICARILRQEGQHLGLDRAFAIYDDADQLDVLKDALEELGIDGKQFAPRKLLSAISAAKSQLRGPEEVAALRRTYFDEVFLRVYRQYEELLTRNHALDFDDLLVKATHLFQDNPEVLARYQERYVHILVDEFQDTNVVQYLLARQLAGKHRNICVVGDPDQSIYSWRQADIRNILNFQKDFPEAAVVMLEQNYRSSQTVLQAALAVIAPNKERKPIKLWTQNPTGAPVCIMEAYNEQDEALFVVSEVEKLTKAGAGRPGDCAVMYRTNAQSRVLEETCMRYGLPYRLVGGLRFYERREVKDVLAYLRLVYNPYDEVSLQRIVNVPGRGIGPRTIEELLHAARSQDVAPWDLLQQATAGQPPSVLKGRAALLLSAFAKLIQSLVEASTQKDCLELFDLAIEKTGYKEHVLNADEEGEEKWENVLELRTVASQFRDLPPREGLEAFLENVALVSDVDSYEARAEAITLITLHLAKGLEFPVVFIVGLEEGLLPHRRAIDDEHADPGELEEERRLLYVGMTRAKERLYLTRAFRRTALGYSGPSAPSRFLTDLPRSLTASPKAGAHERLLMPAKEPVIRRIPANDTVAPVRAAIDYKAGDHVRHATFGEGIVIGVKPSAADVEVTVAFKGAAGIKRLLLSLAPLEKI